MNCVALALPTPRVSWLDAAEARLADGMFGATDRHEAEARAKVATGTELERIVLLLARYTRGPEAKPGDALTILAPALLPASAAKDWVARYRVEEKRRAEVKDKTSGPTDAPSPTTSAAMLAQTVPFPPPGEWTLTPAKVELALEATRAHVDLHLFPEALAILNTVGSKYEGLNRILAAEAGGDLARGMGDLKKAVDFYDYALAGFAFITQPDSRAGKARALTPVELTAKWRIEKSRVETFRLLEIESYGVGWVRYRDADHVLRDTKDYATAFLLWDDMATEFSGTVYGEAAACMGTKALLALAVPGNRTTTAAAVKTAGEVVTQAESRLKLLRRALAPDAALHEAEQASDQAKKWLGRLEQVPVGAKAAKLARSRADAFLAASEFGLYRGETLVDMADFTLEVEHDAERAILLYARARDWFAKVADVEATLVRFDIPDKARRVAAPPPEMKSRDDWGNFNWSRLETGKVFNRRTSAWYVPYYRMQAQTKWSLCSFILGRQEEAQQGLEIILEVDAADRALAQRGLPNSFFRLRDEFKAGRMFATSTELKPFHGQARTALLVAEFYFEVEQWARAEELYQRVNRQYREQLPPNAGAYLDFMLGNCAMMLGRRDEALLAFHKFDKEYAHTPTWPRAMLTLYNLYQFDPKTKDKALAYLRSIYQRQPDTEEGRFAFYHQGEFLFGNGRYGEAATVFATCQKQYKDTWLARGAGQYLQKLGQLSGTGGNDKGKGATTP